MKSEDPDGFTLNKELLVPLGAENPLELIDLRQNVMGLRFLFDEDAFQHANFLLNAPADPSYRVILVPKNDDKVNKRGQAQVDDPPATNRWNFFIPVSDRFEYTMEARHYINVSLLAQLRLASHVDSLNAQYAGNAELVNAAFASSFNVAIFDSFTQARQVVDNGLEVLVPSESPAVIELPMESKETEDGPEE